MDALFEIAKILRVASPNWDAKRFGLEFVKK